jgi:uncharacterized protein YcfJ
MNVTTTNHSLHRLGTAIATAVLALGLSSAAFAHHTDHGHRDSAYRNGHSRPIVHNHYYQGPRQSYRRRHQEHRRHGHRRHSQRQVIVQHRYYPPVEVVEVYEQPRPVVTRTVERRTSGSATSRNNNQLNAGSLIGAAVGGLLGSQVGGGKGKLAATAAGAVGGFLLGNHATQRVR